MSSAIFHILQPNAKARYRTIIAIMGITYSAWPVAILIAPQIRTNNSIKINGHDIGSFILLFILFS